MAKEKDSLKLIRSETQGFSQPIQQVVLMLIALLLVMVGSYFMFPSVAPIFLSSPYLNGVILAQFRDRRINDGVRAAQYDLIIIRHAIKIARLEWGVFVPNNPVDDIRIPNGVRRRERRLREHEYERLELAAQSLK